MNLNKSFKKYEGWEYKKESLPSKCRHSLLIGKVNMGTSACIMLSPCSFHKNSSDWLIAGPHYYAGHKCSHSFAVTSMVPT